MLAARWRLEPVDVALTALGQPAPPRNGLDDQSDLIAPHHRTDETPSVGEAPAAGEIDDEGQATTGRRADEQVDDLPCPPISNLPHIPANLGVDAYSISRTLCAGGRTAGHSTDPYIGQPSTGGEQRLVERTGILDSRYMPTLLVRLLVVLGLSVLCGVGCSSIPRSSGDLDRRSGCSLVVAERTQDRAQVVMDMHASGCRDQNGQLLERAQAVDRVAHAVWQSLELPVDAVRVSVSAPGALPEGTPTTIARDDLTERFGRGPSGVVWPVRDRPDETIWVVLPLAYLAAGVAMLLLVRGLRRAGVVVVLLRR